MTFEGTKKQEGRGLDRGRSMSKDKELEGQGSIKVWEGKEKDPIMGVDLGKVTEYGASQPERLVMVELVMVVGICEVEWEVELKVNIEEE